MNNQGPIKTPCFINILLIFLKNISGKNWNVINNEKDVDML